MANADSHMITVGTNQFAYNQVRNFTGLPFTDIQFRKVNDLYKIPAFIKFKLFNKVDYNLVYKFDDFGFNSHIHLFHFFNAITPVKKPWVVTYEHLLPRPNVNFKRGYEWLASQYCKKIIAFSERALVAQQLHLENFPRYKDAILPKMMLLHPSQRLFTENISDKNFEGDIHFVFAGSAFYRKGGYELVKAFEMCKKKNLPVKLSIVSKMEIEGYCDKNITTEIENETRAMIAGNPKIVWYKGLPNNKVLELLKDAHVGILPSFGETYGYFLLEAMGCGCAAVATSLSPFPEIIDENSGYLVPVATEKKLFEYVDIDNASRYADISADLTGAIYKRIESICNNRSELKEKATNAIQRIKSVYSPLDRVTVLKRVYEEAMSN
jgi:glycosyltransferase involved in cell wall biosynthesis